MALTQLLCPICVNGIDTILPCSICINGVDTISSVGFGNSFSDDALSMNSIDEYVS
jgi:hypothetical protein